MKGELESPIALTRWKGIQRRIGITGGIGTGKTSVGDYLAKEKNLPVLDADHYAKNLLNQGTSATEAVIKEFGHEITTDNQKGMNIINRKKLAEIIFNNPSKRVWLENLIHPLVKDCLEKDLCSKKSSSTIILSIPLLFEAKLTYLCSEIWVITCTKEQQYQRLKERNKLNTKEVDKRISAQWSLSKKMKYADHIIHNEGNPRKWIKQVNYILGKNQP